MYLQTVDLFISLILVPVTMMMMTTKIMIVIIMITMVTPLNTPANIRLLLDYLLLLLLLLLEKQQVLSALRISRQLQQQLFLKETMVTNRVRSLHQLMHACDEDRLARQALRCHSPHHHLHLHLGL